jgi:hypothetical protein
MHVKAVFTVLFFLFCTAIVALGMRGLPGNPTAEDLSAPEWKENGPFELSPERGRFALLYSLAEDRSTRFSVPVARFAAPDVALSPGGGYTSLFAPGVSFLMVPGYEAGKRLGLSQLGATATIALFALLNVLLVRAIALRLGAHPFAANLAALSFLFATPAFAYAVSLYQHHVSTFLILASLYALLRFGGLWPVALTWFCYALAVAVDNPNAILMAPIILYAAKRLIDIQGGERSVEFRINVYGLATLVAALLPLLFFLWFNQAANGGPWRLSGTLPQVRIIDAEGNPVWSDPTQGLKAPEGGVEGRTQDAAGFFQSRNLLNGFYILFVSPDRGILWYAPIALLGIWGLAWSYAGHPSVMNVLAGIAGVTAVLYSLWGDPQGGWAFGSRYLIPAYAVLCVGVALLLTHVRKNTFAMAVFCVLFGYSTWVNALGAVTSNANPPQSEVLNLERLSGKEQKYTYARNWQYLNEAGSKSFVFRTYASGSMSAVQYHQLLAGLLWAALVWYAARLHWGLEFLSKKKE